MTEPSTICVLALIACMALVLLQRRSLRRLREFVLLHTLDDGGEWYVLELVEAAGGSVPRWEVYGLLADLEDRQLVQSRPGARSAPARRLYRLTPAGRAVVSWQLRRARGGA